MLQGTRISAGGFRKSLQIEIEIEIQIEIDVSNYLVGSISISISISIWRENRSTIPFILVPLGSGAFQGASGGGKNSFSGIEGSFVAALLRHLPAIGPQPVDAFLSRRRYRRLDPTGSFCSPSPTFSSIRSGWQGSDFLAVPLTLNNP